MRSERTMWMERRQNGNRRSLIAVPPCESDALQMRRRRRRAVICDATAELRSALPAGSTGILAPIGSNPRPTHSAEEILLPWGGGNALDVPLTLNATGVPAASRLRFW